MSKDTRFVLIGGVDRSGTTMLGSMLGNHSRGICVPEAQFKWEVFNRIRAHSKITRKDLLDILDDSFRFDTWKLSRQKVRESLPEKMEDEIWYRHLAELYREKHFPWKKENELRYVVDHSPTNIRYPCFYEECFSDVRFVHIVRDGRGVAKSVMSKDGGANTILNATTYWSDRLCYGLAAEDILASDKIIRIRYEDVLLNTEESLREISDFLGMSFEPELCGETDFNVTEFSKSRHRLVGQAPKPERATAWRSELTDRQVELFEANTGDLLEYLGYDREYPCTTARPTRFERWWGYLYEQFRILWDKFRYRWRRLKIYLNM